MWTNNFYRMGIYAPGYGGTSYWQRHREISFTAAQYEQSITFMVTSAYTGTFSASAFYKLGSSGLHMSENTRLYITDDFNFDTNTGAPKKYLGYAEGSSSDFSIYVRINVTRNKTYWITFSGLQSPTDQYTMDLSFQSILTKYDQVFRPQINDLCGIYNDYITEFSNLIVTIPIKLKYDGVLWFKSGYWENIYPYLTTNEIGIDVDTGIPLGNQVEYTYITPHQPKYGVGWELHGGQTYYLYFAGYNTWNENYRDPQYKLLLLQTSVNLDEGQSCSINAIITDYNGNTCGSFKFCYNHTPINAWWGHYKGFEAWSVYHTPVYLCWDPVVNIPTGYKQAIFQGWYSDANCTQLISTEPCIMYICKNLGVNTVYGKVYYSMDDFDWTSVVQSGSKFNITAHEWDSFVMYAAQKFYDGVRWDRFEYFDDGAYTFNYTITLFSNCRPTGSLIADGTFKAWQFNKVKGYLDRVTSKVLEPELSNVRKGDIIYASYMQNILTEAKTRE